MSAFDPVTHVFNKEYAEQSQSAHAFDTKVREISDWFIDTINMADVQESLEYLNESERPLLLKAIKDGDLAEVGRIVVEKAVYRYADTLGEIKAETAEPDEPVFLKRQAD